MQQRKIITRTQADLIGNGRNELISLTGFQAPGSFAWQDIRLEIYGGANGGLIQLPLVPDSGYDPRLWIGDLTGSGRPDVLASVSSGGSGASQFATVFTWENGRFRQIFSTEQYHAEFVYTAAYQDQYWVSAISYINQREYRIDLSGRGFQYLNSLYRQNGQLRQPVNGQVDPASLIYPVDFENSGSYRLLIYQKISGQFEADTLGGFINILAWNGSAFALSDQWAAIPGNKTNAVQPR